jgi:hypothetical protein
MSEWPKGRPEVLHSEGPCVASPNSTRALSYPLLVSRNPEKVSDGVEFMLVLISVPKLGEVDILPKPFSSNASGRGTHPPKPTSTPNLNPMQLPLSLCLARLLSGAAQVSSSRPMLSLAA